MDFRQAPPSSTSRAARAPLRGAEADVEVEPPGRGQLLGEEAAERPAVDAPDDLADEMAVEAGDLAVPRPGHQERRLRRQQLDDALPVEQRLGRLRFLEDEQPGLVGEQVADERRLLARARVLGPDARDGGVEVELAPIGEQQGARGDERLRDRVGVRDRVLLPGPAEDGVGEPRPEIDDRRPVQVDRDRGAELSALLEALLERVTDGREGGIAGSMRLDGHGGSMPGNAPALLFSSR